MKKKFVFGILLFLFVVSFTLFCCHEKEQLSILSFHRYDNGKEIESILSWSPVEKVKEYKITCFDKYQNVLLETTSKKEKIDIQNSQLMEEERFFVTVQAIKQNGKTVTSNQYGTSWKKEQKKVSVVTSNREDGKVKGRKKIKLKTASPNATIYYTLDGSLPNTDSEKYIEPIELKKSVMIKAIATKEGYEDSDIATFMYEVTSTNPVVYLSPSTQTYNVGIKGTGYTNESEMMNQIADVVEPILKKNKIEVYRNKPTMTAALSIRDSRKLDVDLHLAIHSNASPESKKGSYTGVETWVYDKNCVEAEEIAKKLQQSIVDLYYNRYGDRGVLYSREIGGLKETNPYNVNNGILLEVAFHDNWNDAVWIVKNVEKIGKAIAEVIIAYYK